MIVLELLSDENLIDVAGYNANIVYECDFLSEEGTTCQTTEINWMGRKKLKALKLKGFEVGLFSLKRILLKTIIHFMQ